MIAEAKARHPGAAIHLAGHSLGASFAEAYAAHYFQDGSSGADDLAGLILIDGVLGAVPMGEEEHLAAPLTSNPIGAFLRHVAEGSHQPVRRAVAI